MKIRYLNICLELAILVLGTVHKPYLLQTQTKLSLAKVLS